MFDSPRVQTLIEEYGLDLKPSIDRLKGAAKAKRYTTRNFPAYREGDEASLNDEQVKEMFAEMGFTVHYIEYVRGAIPRSIADEDSDSIEDDFSDERPIKERKLHMSHYADMVNLEAIEKIINLHGMYAPKKIDTRIGVFSMADMRKKMREEGVSIVEYEQPETAEPQP